MKNLLVIFTTLLLLESACPAAFQPSKAHTLLQRSCQYLWSQQSADGGWHSKEHNALRGGGSLSAFTVYTLLQVPEWIYEADEKQMKKAVQFLRRMTNNDGVLSGNDPDFLDRPNFATAYALLVLKEINTKRDSVLIQKMTHYLKKQQFTEHRGFSPQQYAYGAWGLGEPHLPKGKTGLVDLTHTRLCLLALEGTDGFDSIAFKATSFFSLAQKQPKENRWHATGIPHQNIPYNGGFFESPVTLSANKAGIKTDPSGVPHYFRSYATATCEGILGLLAAGKTKEDATVHDAFRWLEKHPKWLYPEGIPVDDPEQWREVLFFYHLAVRSEVYALIDKNENWQRSVIKLLEKRQQSDGSFRNELGGAGMEDDKLVATGLAVAALSWALH